MILHGYWRSSASYRVRLALGLKGISVEHRAVNLKDGEQHGAAHATRNVQAMVPVLELDDGTHLTQSLSIIEYLDEMFPQPALLPADPVLRSRVRAASLIIAADVMPIQNLRVLKFLRAEYGQDDAGVSAWARHWIANGFASLERTVAHRDGEFFVPDGPGMFECCLVPQVFNAVKFGLDMSAFPHLLAIHDAAQQISVFDQARPEQQHDAPSS
ncbi:MAG: maleylacetoacetate isomerase [Pseudomonadota bacterium]